jgi:uncharacterized protein involved in exopolysaccharide biosynthesis
MGDLDLKYYLAVFWRRFPYFLLVTALISAVGLALAAILPPVYRSTATLLVEMPQIPDDLAQSTVPVSPIEQIQIIERRLTTRATLLDLASRFGVHAGHADMSTDDIVEDMRARILFVTQQPLRNGRPIDGATVVHVSFDAPQPAMAAAVTNELTTLILQENVRLRTERATDTQQFFEQQVTRLAGELDRNASEISEFKRANQDALPDSLDYRRNEQTLNQERLLQLEREEAPLRDARARIVQIYEQTGRVPSMRELSPEEQTLETLRRQLDEARAVYSETSPNVTLLKSRIAALEPLVADQRAIANPQYAGMSEYEIQLADLDGRLAFIASEKARIQGLLDDLDRSIRATPANEMRLLALEREQANLRAQYDAAEARLAQASMGERIEALAKGERLTLVEQATAPQVRLKPNRLLIGGGSVAAGVGAGLGLIVLMELLNRSIRRPVELTTRLGIQPYATIPYIETDRESGRRRGITATLLALITVAIPAALYMIHTFYLPLDLILRNLADDLGLRGIF